MELLIISIGMIVLAAFARRCGERGGRLTPATLGRPIRYPVGIA